MIRSMQNSACRCGRAFMLGNPGETEETMEESIRFAIRLNPDLVQFNVSTPFPGTEMFDWAEKNHYLLTTDWDDYDLSRPVMRLPTVEPDVVERYYRQAHRRFFLRPRFSLKRLLEIRHMEDSVSAFRGLRMIVNT